MRNQKTSYRRLSILFLLIVLTLFFVLIWDAQGSQFAPINPKFLQYLEDLKAGKIQKQTEEGYGLGFIPPTVDLSYLKGQKIMKFRSLVSLPASYDLRTLGRVTPVKNQGSYGTCWAFASYGSLESCLMPGETWDFSENNLVNLHGFDSGFDEGGNHYMSTAYLARWSWPSDTIKGSGPVRESDDPYPVPGGSLPLPPLKHLQEILFLPDRGSPTDNDNIKQAVMEYGAVYTSMRWRDASYNASHYAYYYDGPLSSNHAVAIVGWDDNFDRTKFNKLPPGNGAFIVKNSWGTSWGESGYFYVSYYDSNIGKDNAVFNNAEATTNYSTVYQYDPLGWVGMFTDSSYTWGANIFTATANHVLKAVSFYTPSINSNYEIYIYTNVNSEQPRSGTQAAYKSGTISVPGYHTISLDSSVSIASGQRFSVVLKLTAPGFSYSPIALEYRYSGYSSQAMANAGESYISTDGSSWSDITGSPYYINICLKAFACSTLTVSGTAMEPVSIKPGDTGVVIEKLTLTASGTSVTMNSIKIDETGSSSADADVSSVKLYDDANNNGQVDVGETLLGSGSFSSQTVTISGLNYTVEAGTPRNILIVYDISSSANTGVTLGAKLANNTYVTVASPAEVLTTNFPIVSDNWLIYKWIVTLGAGDPIEASPSIRDGIIYIGGNNGYLYALDSTDGSILWSFATEGNSSIKYGVVVVKESDIPMAYFATQDGKVYKVNTTSHALAWLAPASIGAVTMPAVWGGYVYVGCIQSGNSAVCKLNPTTGETLAISGPLDGTVSSPPCVDSSGVYIGTTSKIYRIQISDFNLRLEFPTGSEIDSFTAAPFLTADNGILYVGSGSGKFYALNASNFTLIWTFSAGGALKSSPFIDVVTKRAYFGTEEGRVYCLENIDTTVPNLRWKYPPEGSPAIGAVRTCPVVYNGVVYFGSQDGYIYALNASDGSLKWRTKTGGAVSASPAIGSGILSIGSTDGKVYSSQF